MTDADKPLTIPHAAEAAARLWPEQAAIIERGETWTFAQLWGNSRSIASSMLASGITPDTRVAIWGPNSREWIVVAIAAMTIGAQIVPLNTRLKGREAADQLRRTRTHSLFTVGDFLGLDYVGSLSDHDLPDLSEAILIDRELDAYQARGKGIRDDGVDVALASVGADTVSDILFTSGTTGQPKGVVMTHGRVLPQCREWIANAGLRAGDRYLIANPFFHSFGTKVGWVACLLAGATAVPMAQFDVEEAVALIEGLGITFLPGPPTIFQMLLARRDAQPFDTQSLRGGTTGAATVPPALVSRIRADLGIADIITAYGMTECVNITGCRPGDSIDRIAKTCGTSIPGNEVRILGDDGGFLPVGEVGEIVVRGEGVMLGYLDDPIATALAIDRDGWLHTGDVGMLDADGYLTITDRKKDMFISGGFNVYPAEVEKQIAAHPSVAQVAVVGVPDERLGEVGRAFVVLNPGSREEMGTIANWARTEMANYKVPREFVSVASLPVNASGKVMKNVLRAAPPPGR